MIGSRRWTATVAIVAAVGLAGALVWFRPPRKPVMDDGRAGTASAGPLPAPRAPEPTEAPFRHTPAAVCAECHQEIVDDYSRSAMSRSWRTLGKENIALPPAGGPVHDREAGYAYHAVADAERLRVEETFSLPGLSEPGRFSVEAAYQIGSGEHAAAFAARDERGCVWMLPLAWFSAEQRWRFSPGYENQNLRFSRPVVPRCVSCHASFGAVERPTLNRYRGVIVDGIGCERCHGDAQGHIARWGTGSAGDSEPLPDVIVNPGKLPPARANDVCFQCHLQGIVSLGVSGGNDFQYRPGDALSDHRHEFLIDTGDPNAFGVASHASRMMRSRCFTASDGRLTCITCHDPHRAVRDQREEDESSARGVPTLTTLDRRCLSCHEEPDCTRPPPAERSGKPVEVRCNVCHMPRRSTREGQHLVFTDHWIRKPGPSGPEEAPVFRPASLVLDADTANELIPVWPEADPDKVRLGSANVWFHEYVGPQRPSLARGVRLLEAARTGGALDADGWYWLGAGLLAQGRAGEAVEALTESARRRNDVRTRFKRALARWEAGERIGAVEEMELVVAAVPDWTEPYVHLVDWERELGRTERGTKLLRLEVERSQSPRALSNLAVVLMEDRDRWGECESLLREALRLDPRFVQARLNLGSLQYRQGKKDEALRTYRDLLRIEPDHPQAQAAVRALSR